MRRKLAAGNWKMNGTADALAMLDNLEKNHPTPSVDVLICPPATLLERASGRGAIATGGQDCHANVSGAHTGDISAQMIVDAGGTYVLTGHSERRTDHAETDAMIAAKSLAAYSANLIAVICIGETLEQRESETTLAVLDAQLAGSMPDTATAANSVIAYEPVWAIGTGKVPTTEQIAEVHTHIRTQLIARFTDGDGFRILYGGSVKASNAAEIFAVANVDGALVGGASLKASDFSPIITALENA
jgi:triosephosphate isomerase